MGKKDAKKPAIDLTQIAQRGLELREIIADAQNELEKEILPVIKRAKSFEYSTFAYGDVELKTEPQRALNKARVLERFGKKATERTVTAASFARLGLSKDEAKEFYDESELPKVTLRRIGGE